MIRPHWDFVDRLIRAEPCNITIPLYGLAPEHTYGGAFTLLTQVYRSVLEKHAPEDIVFMGDSAGGGLALAFAQMLKDSELPQPGSIVLLSPWLDITLSNPDIADIEKKDPLLAVPGNQEAGRMWAGGADPRIPLLSPINGSLKGLAPVCLLIGDHDMLMPDARRLRDTARAEGHSLSYREYKSMFHVWMLLPLPESERALQDIVEFMRHPSAG